MPYVQNTEEDVQQMLAAIGVKSIDDLFAPIPAELRFKGEMKNIAPAKSEADVIRDLQNLARKNRDTSSFASFLGGGIERHFIPHVVDHISLDGNFITAYTPYQPEVSQGTLTSIFQFQTMVSSLTGFPISNASLYDGATAVAEAVMLSLHSSQKKHKKENRRKVVTPVNLHPEYRATLNTYAHASGLVDVVEVGYDKNTGLIDRAAFNKAIDGGGVLCALLPYPSFFGTVEDLRPLVEKVHAADAVAVAVANPIALSLLATPGEMGCDVAVGEGQPLGCYQALGGPAFGFFSCKEDFIRHMPGRIVSQTVDIEGKRAFCLALKTREQDIRREKATSNICTNQALMALRAVIYLAAWGKRGFVELGEQVASNARYAAQALEKAGAKRRFASAPFFNEFVVEGPADLEARGRKAGILPGINLSRFHSDMKNCYLISVSELNTKDEIDRLAALFR
ncbi:MAG: aminomethyl-transferring glycine dehydrogenase subunit GcvPA [Planctomycetes bacterium]|nr:aminomethyl-transferring glycine dehydrogenase subunit GcvPA [Planctomycetota bacterium]NUQ33747.1 aminomethyl-transferring glycine dehydrogenase subunit GcvPA [Planctomycetaceae bacterium]